MGRGKNNALPGNRSADLTDRERAEYHLNRFLTRYGEGFVSDDTLRSVSKLCHVDIEDVEAIWSGILSEHEAASDFQGISLLSDR